MIVLSLILIIISKFLKIKIKKLRNNHKIQQGKIIYSDLNIPEKSFFSKRYRLIGKPDYIVIKNKKYIPVEVKSGNHLTPKINHIYQLMAYCQLLEENFNSYTPYGIIVYTETAKQFKINFDPKRRFELETIIKEIRTSLHYENIQRNHNEIKKCINCSIRTHCNQKVG